MSADESKSLRLLAGSVGACFLAAALHGQPVRAAASCEGLTSLKLPKVTITLAQAVAAGAFAPGATAGDEPAARPRGFSTLPAFCRVVATLTPSTDSDIKIEVWMPAENWNGKFQAVGNGAFSGTIAYPAMATALGRGYATGSTDTGHEGNTGSFALGHPEKLIDFGWRAVHEMTVTSKTIISTYSSSPPRLSYFNGCSAGGRQGMMEAQRFPADYDGIVAGAPGLDWTGRASQAVRGAQLLEKNEAARLSPTKQQRLHAAVLKACDGLDGIEDGLIGDPMRCTFDPAVLQCSGADDGSCLTAAQVATAKSVYSPLVDARTKRQTSGLKPGSELGWTDLGWTASARATGLDQFRFIVVKDPRWTVAQFNASTDLGRADAADDNTVNALNPNLKPFIERGGKLIQYHGWSDPQISPGNSVQYYQDVLKTVDARTVQGSHRLFMAPGMAHCGGGEGPNTFDMMGALERWVEQRQTPDQIIALHATNGTVDRTRPLCPYPQVAKYNGSGSTDQAANFSCKTP
jgi:feruloyl esterase